MAEFIKIPTRPMKLVEFKVPEAKSDEKSAKDSLMNFMKKLEQLKANGEEREAIIRILIRNATSELKTNLNLKQDAINAILKSAFYWDMDFELRKDEVHPSVSAGEVFLKPSEELTRYVSAVKKMSEGEKKQIIRLGEKILGEVLEKTGEEQ